MITLKAARQRAGLSQAELAARVGCDGSYISILERGLRPISSARYVVLVRIARELKVNPFELFPVPPLRSQRALALVPERRHV